MGGWQVIFATNPTTSMFVMMRPAQRAAEREREALEIESGYGSFVLVICVDHRKLDSALELGSFQSVRGVLWLACPSRYHSLLDNLKPSIEFH